MNDCYCDFDPPEFYSARIVKNAKKQFKCCECGGETWKVA